MNDEDVLGDELRASIRRGAETITRALTPPQQPSFQRAFAGVTKVNADGTLDILFQGTALTSVPATTSCFGVNTSSTVVVDFFGTQAIVTGVVADNLSALGSSQYTREIIYDRPDKADAAPYVCTEEPAHFETITVCYKTNDLYEGTQEVRGNAGGFALFDLTAVNDSTAYLKIRNMLISGKTIDTHKTDGVLRNLELHLGGGWEIQHADNIWITRIYGNNRIAR